MHLCDVIVIHFFSVESLNVIARENPVYMKQMISIFNANTHIKLWPNIDLQTTFGIFNRMCGFIWSAMLIENVDVIFIRIIIMFSFNRSFQLHNNFENYLHSSHLWYWVIMHPTCFQTHIIFDHWICNFMNIHRKHVGIFWISTLIKTDRPFSLMFSEVFFFLNLNI